MSFYRIVDGENPTDQNKLLTVRKTGQTEGTPSNQVIETNVHDETLNGSQARVLNSIKVPNQLDMTPGQWASQSIEREYKDGLKDGRKSLAIPISGPGSEPMQRSDSDKEFYQSTVVNEVMNLARKNGDDFMMQKTADGTEYASITPTDRQALDPIKGAFVTYQALQADMTPDQIVAKLKEHGYAEEDLVTVNKYVSVISQAAEQGLPMADIEKGLRNAQTTTDTTSAAPAPAEAKLKLENKRKYHTGVSTQTPYEFTKMKMAERKVKQASKKETMYTNLLDPTVSMTAEEVVSALKVVKPTMTSVTMTDTPAFFGNKQALQRYDDARLASRQRIITIAKEKYNLDLLWQGEGVGAEGWYVQGENGLQEVTPSFLKDVSKMSGEITGAVGLGILGAKRGAKFGVGVALVLGQAGPQALAPEEVVTGPVGGVIGGLLGGLTGAAIGAAGGSQFDYLLQLFKINEDMEAEIAAHKAMNAAEASAMGDAIGYPVIRGLGAGWGQIIRAKNFIMGGETKAAYQALKESTYLTDDQIQEIVLGLEKFATLKGNEYEKGIQAVALTEPGMQSLVHAAGTTKPSATAAVAQSVLGRTEDVLNQVAELTDENAARFLVNDLRNYTLDVKTQYDNVKKLATQSPNGLNFEWDFEELAVQPVLESLRKQITDPATRDKFLLQMSRINTLSESKSFGDLIELRQLVNNFMYNSNIVRADDTRALREVINKIDGAIEEGAPYVLEKPEEWLEQWAKARSDYSQMKQVEKTALHKAIINKEGKVRAINPEQVLKAVGKQITALDGNFEAVMAKLPMAGRKMYEGAALSLLVQKYVVGMEQGMKVIQFPMLSEDLAKVTFTTPDARATKQALMEIAEVFKNDAYLGQTAGQVNIPQFQSFLTADPVVRMKFEVASGMFNFVRSKLPGEKNRQLALVRATARLLTDPLDAKNFKVLQEEVFGDANLSASILKLQQEAAANRMKEIDIGTPRIRVDANGKIIGRGGDALAADSIPLHRIATLEQVQQIADAEYLTLVSPSLDAILKKYGIKAVQSGTDRVRILGDN